MKNRIPKLIATDLDGTLLTTDKRLTDFNLRMLRQAWEQYGIEVVPTTGRMLSMIPEQIRNMPFVHYMIVENGANILDLRSENSLYSCTMDTSLADRICSFLDEKDVLYDCYLKNRAYMPSEHLSRVGDFIIYNPPYLETILRDWNGVNDFHAFLRQAECGPSKMQYYVRPGDPADFDAVRKEVQEAFPEILQVSTMTYHAEIGRQDAGKGEALQILSGILEIPRESILAFGDGGNDLSMLRFAGNGVAMRNAAEYVRKKADAVTDLTCDESGVGDYLEKYFK